MQDTTRSTGSAASETSGSTATDSSIHEIIVVGGGAGGIELVTRLGDTLGKRGRARITLVDKSRTHLWKPLLHVVAAGSMDPSEVERNYLAHAHRHHFNYRVGEMTGLDRGQQRGEPGAPRGGRLPRRLRPRRLVGELVGRLRPLDPALPVPAAPGAPRGRVDV